MNTPDADRCNHLCCYDCPLTREQHVALFDYIEPSILRLAPGAYGHLSHRAYETGVSLRREQQANDFPWLTVERFIDDVCKDVEAFAIHRGIL